MNRIEEIASFYRGFGIKHPNMYSVLIMKIPVPTPIAIQKEIVRILDNLTSLTAELTARNKQYEYYNDKLLNEGVCENSGDDKSCRGEASLSRMVRLEDCCIILDNKHKIVTKSAREKGKYPYYGANGI